MKEDYKKDKFGRDVAVFIFKTAIHTEVILTKYNLYSHIQKAHPEVNIDIIKEVLESPSKVFEVQKKDKIFYYEKTMLNHTYLVVVGEKTAGPFKKVLTAFQLTDLYKNRFNRIHCIYDSERQEPEEDELIKQLESDEDYFKNLFSMPNK